MATPEQAARLEQQDLTALGARIRDVRRAAGLGQADVGARVGVSISYISRIEAGKRRCDLSLLSKIADSLDVAIDSLLDEPSVAPPSPPALPRPPELDFAAVALEMGEAATALHQLEAISAGDRKELRFEVTLLRGRALEALGQLGEAIEVLELIQLPTTDPIADVAIAISLSRCYRESGEVMRAIRVGESALEALAAANLMGTDESVQLSVTVAAAYFEQGDRDYAVRLCRRTLAVAEQSGTARARASAYWNCAIMDLERGQAESAIEMARRALALLGEGRDDRNLGRLQAELGVMELRLSPPDLDQAEIHLHQGLDLLHGSSAGQVDIQHVEHALARLALARGLFDEAYARASSIPSALEGTVPQLEAQALVTAGEALAELHDQKAAHRLFLQAVAVLAGVDDLRSIAQLWLDLGSRLQAVGDTDAAADAFQRAAVAAGLTPSVPAFIAVAPSTNPPG